MNEPNNPKFYLDILSNQNLKELFDVCRDHRTIGLCFGKPGVGKTTAAKRLAKWDLVEANIAARNSAPVMPAELIKCDTLFYHPSVTVTAPRLRSEVAILRSKFQDVIARAVGWIHTSDWERAVQQNHVKLIVVDEAHRLKYQALEELRDLHDKMQIGVVLIGDPGFERALQRQWHFVRRVAYAEEFKQLTEVELIKYVDKHVELMKLPKPKQEVCTLISWYTQCNLRSLGHLFAMIERLMQINDDLVSEIDQEIIETAREMLLFGLNGSLAKPLTLHLQ